MNDVHLKNIDVANIDVAFVNRRTKLMKIGPGRHDSRSAVPSWQSKRDVIGSKPILGRLIKQIPPAKFRVIANSVFQNA